MMTHEVVRYLSTYFNNKSVAYNKKWTLPFCSHNGKGIFYRRIIPKFITDNWWVFFSQDYFRRNWSCCKNLFQLYYKTSAFRSHNFIPKVCLCHWIVIFIIKIYQFNLLIFTNLNKHKRSLSFFEEKGRILW